ncbi:hypothetical protein D2N39_02880 [Gemmobacter lutimaris]|uniref:VCBS repeat-containing protein n=1 Tax=Gemmobacter lutimaris TaxID=2306023 RepID=A0A398C3P3_9RHOB|nr:hypothetical protein [Gemmobacter lutimaris]RID93853.1 hypothetical protein D2N39_02880 [Gemmobacter lutimaris]
MRLLLPAALLIAATPLAAQDLQPLDPLPEAVLAILSQAEAPEFVLGWQSDLDGDGDADLLTQAAYAEGGGNTAVLRQMVLRREGESWTVWQEFVAPDGIKSARLDTTAAGRELVLTVFSYQPDDPHCCPSGTSEMRLPLK